MSNPTTWPDPERAGVPLFAFHEGKHVVRTRLGSDILILWKPLRAEFLTQNGKVFPIESALRCQYIGPILTPTLIEILLAGEREVCAAACDEKAIFANNKAETSGSHEEERYWRGEHCAATFCADTIRNMGDVA